MTSETARAPVRPPFWRDIRVLKVVVQVAFLVVVLTLGWVLWNSLIGNMRDSGLPTSFDFLNRPAGFTIIDSDFRPAQTNLDAILVGVKNTVLVSAVGVVLATVIGILIGIARLSRNWLVRKSAAFYVESLRNVPVLLIIFFASLAVIGRALPRLENAWQVGGMFLVSNRLIAVPWLASSGEATLHAVWPAVLIGIPAAALAFGRVRRRGLGERWRRALLVAGPLVALLVVGGAILALVGEPSRVSAAITFWASIATAITVAVLVAGWRTRVNQRTGQPHHRVLWALGSLLLLGAAAFIMLGAPLEVTGPRLEERRVIGGITMIQAYAALLVALTLYTASHIAEIVRGSIQAVPKGQTEAATALALSPTQRMRFVILPQALRIMVPPLANQYLNLTKNSSLGVAIGFQELTTVTGTVIGNGNPATQSIAILMLIYLSFSLLISLVTNIINRRLQVAGRR